MMRLENKVLLNLTHHVSGHCDHCHTNRMVKVSKSEIAKYHGPFCKECGHVLSI